MNLSSRPFRKVNVAVRYRFNKRDVQTPTFDATEYVRFDAVPEEIEEGLSHQFDTSRQIFDANISYTPARFGTLRVGYGHEAVERHGRGFSDVGENIFRVSFDTYSSQYVTVRAGFDAGRRRGEGFVETRRPEATMKGPRSDQVARSRRCATTTKRTGTGRAVRSCSRSCRAIRLTSTCRSPAARTSTWLTIRCPSAAQANCSVCTSRP